METIIGFAAGYLAGAREGKAGLERLKSSVEAIVKSQEARKLAREAVSVGGMLVRSSTARRLGASARGVAELALHRVNENAVAKRRTTS